MVDVAAFFDPTGGREFGRNMSNSTAGLTLTFALEGVPFILPKVDKWLLEPLRRNEFRSISKRAKDTRLSLRKAELYQSRGWYDTHSGLIPEPNRNLAVRDAFREKYRASDRFVAREARAARKAAGAYWRGASRMAHGIGWTMAATFALDATMELFTPGISKVAARREAELFSDTQASDSPRAYTMRQRALEAIYNSQSSLRNVIGREADYLHS